VGERSDEGPVRTRKTIVAYAAGDLLALRDHTSVLVERWMGKDGRWHARTVFGEVFGPEVESDSAVGIWFLAAARYFEDTAVTRSE
jgi:hypothetical protein